MLRIGELAKQVGVSPDTLRYYERLGLISRAARTDGGYRQYPASALEEVRFIRSALQFGFSLKQVAQFRNARESGRAPCQQVRIAAEDILARVEAQIKELQAARLSIRKTLREWDDRLSSTPAGTPARLLQTLKADPITSDCLSVSKTTFNRHLRDIDTRKRDNGADSR